MKAQELINAVKECKENHWENSDISRRSEIMFEMIADHFDTCEDCRNQFDSMEYKRETLIDFIGEIHFDNTNLEDWICIYEIDGTIINIREWEIPIFCEKCGLEIEEEAIAKDDKPYHYRCSGIEL